MDFSQRDIDSLSLCASLLGMEAPLDCHDTWQQAMEDMSDLDFDADGYPALVAGLLHKRLDHDGLAINWGHKLVLILEISRRLNSRVDWHIVVNQRKTERYTSR